MQQLYFTILKEKKYTNKWKNFKKIWKKGQEKNTLRAFASQAKNYTQNKKKLANLVTNPVYKNFYCKTILSTWHTKNPNKIK